MIFVNFKTYQEGTGKRALELVQLLGEVQTETGVQVIPVVQLVDLRYLAQALAGEVWVQHVDGIEHGQHTGWILPEAVKEAGSTGTFLNHSERKIDPQSLATATQRCQQVGLKTLIFAADLDELKRVVGFRPDLVAYEPPELIASPTTSVAKAKPELIADAVKIAKEAGVPLIVGAGIKDAQDVKKSLELGAVGIAVSSAVVLAKDPKEVVQELALGFKS